MTVKWPKVLDKVPFGYFHELAVRRSPGGIASLPVSSYLRHYLLAHHGGATAKTLRLHACWIAIRTIDQYASLPLDLRDKYLDCLGVARQVACGVRPESDLNLYRDEARLPYRNHSGTVLPYWATHWALHEDALTSALNGAWNGQPLDTGRGAWYEGMWQDLLGRIQAQ